MMTVKVEYVAQMRVAAGIDEEVVDIEVGSTAEMLIGLLADRHPGRLAELLLNEDRKLRRSALGFVDDEQLDWGENTVLSEGQKMTLLAPLAGG